MLDESGIYTETKEEKWNINLYLKFTVFLENICST